MRFLFLCTIFLSLVLRSYSQLTIEGIIVPSENWEKKLYVIRIDRLGLFKPVVVDSIHLTKTGKFKYTFLDDPQGMLYELRQPIKGKNINHKKSGLEDHWFFVTTEEKGTIKIKGHSDSLFYSLQIEGGTLNKKMLLFRDMKRFLPKITMLTGDSIRAYPQKEDHFRQKYMAKVLEGVEKFKASTINILDTAKNESILLYSLFNLFEANFGRFEFDQLDRYSSKLKNEDLLLTKNIKNAKYTPEANRVGSYIPDVYFKASDDQQLKLTDLKADFIVIDFWASWCGPCRQANKTHLPKLENYFSSKNIILLGLSIDRDEGKWKEAVKKDKTTWLQVIEPTKVIERVLNVQGIPLYVVVDKNYKVIYESGVSYLVEGFLKDQVGLK